MSLPENLTPLAAEAAAAANIEPLRARRALELRRLAGALGWAAVAFIVALAAAALLLPGASRVPLLVAFPELDLSDIPSQITLRAAAVPDEVALSFGMLFGAFGNLLTSGLNDEIGQVARLVSTLMVAIAVLVTFRRLVLDYYRLNGQPAEADEYARLRGTLAGLVQRTLVALAALLPAYLVTSLAWLALAEMFRRFDASAGFAIVLAALFSGVVTFIVVLWAQTVTTRQLLRFGMLAFVSGLAASFMLAGDKDGVEWWQAAVSRVGEHPNAAWMFTAAFGTLVLVAWVFWFDIDGFVRALVMQAGARRVGSVPSWLRRNAFHIIRVLYALAVLGLLGVGFVRFDPAQPDTVAAHTGGAVLAIVLSAAAGVAIAYYLPEAAVGQTFRRQSVAYAGIGLGALVLTATPYVNLAGIELIWLTLVGLWLNGAVDNILYYVDALASERDPAPPTGAA